MQLTTLRPMHPMVLTLLSSRPTPRVMPPSMVISVCTGGACAESGSELLLEACAALAAGDVKTDVSSQFCSGECPACFAMISPKKGSIEAYEASCSTLEEALASAEAAIATAEVTVTAGLKDAFMACVEAKAAEQSGDMASALQHYSSVLDTVPSSLLEPCQAELASEKAEWAGSKWQESTFSSLLTLSASVDEAEFGICGGATTIVDRKVVTMPEVKLLDCTADGTSLSGRWEDTDGGAGAFELSMSASGRTFDGTLSHADGSESVAWRGTRKTKPERVRGRPVARLQAPPSRVKWLHDTLLGRARCHAALGDASAAVDDATAATALCCRAVTGWVALAEALEALGEAEAKAALAARAEVDFLKAKP